MVSRISEPSTVPWVEPPALSKESVEGKRYKVEGKRYKVEGKRYKVEGKRYKVEGKRYNLCNKTSDDCDSPWTGTRGSELKKRSSL